jgi:hypothetical protein
MFVRFTVDLPCAANLEIIAICVAEALPYIGIKRSAKHHLRAIV